jgi:putative heme iron utilization protein
MSGSPTRKEITLETPFFSSESEAYMVTHMNADHADANLLYVKIYGHLEQATAARMVRLDKGGMELDVTLPEGSRRIRIAFDHHLQDEADAQRTLVAMAMQARDRLPPRPRTSVEYS